MKSVLFNSKQFKLYGISEDGNEAGVFMEMLERQWR
jgi:hypothetical protein